MVKTLLDPETAARLEDAGVGYLDAGGRSWVPGQPKSTWVRSAGRPRGRKVRALRPESLRLAQLLADHPHEAWSERMLAQRGGSTNVTAHRLLARLEDAGLVARRGSGRSTTRHVSDARGLRRWLAKHGRPGQVQRLRCFVRDLGAIPEFADGHLLALTGSVAAERIGVQVLSGTRDPIYRVDAHAEDLEEIPATLGGFRTERGANLTLIADPGRLAHTDARRTADGTLVAPPSRVMLDLFLEPRGEAAVELFLDLWTGEAS